MTTSERLKDLMSKLLIVITMGAMTLFTTCASGALDQLTGGVTGGGPAPASDVALLTEYQRQLLEKLNDLGDLSKQVTYLTELLDMKNQHIDTLERDLEARDETIVLLEDERDTAIVNRDTAKERLENIRAQFERAPEEGS